MQDQGNTRTENLQEIKETAEERGGIPKEILEALPIGVCLTDAEGKFNFVNTRYTEIYGYERSELIGQHFTMVVPGPQKDKMSRRHDKFITDGSEMEGKWEVQRKDGEKIGVQVNAALVEKDEDEGPFKMTFVVDVTNIHVATNHLNATVEMLHRRLEAQELSSHISNHDLRNNVANILQLAELLRGTELDKKQQQWIEIIHQLSERTLNMLRVSNDYIKMERGEYALVLSEFDLLRTLATQTKAYAMEIKDRQLSVDLLLHEVPVSPEQTLVIEADQPYVERMLGNLIGNAVEASPNHRKVRINVSTQDHLRISIHNQGVIPQDVRDRFFDKFATADKKDGTGLGTYIAKLVVNLHGGDIYFDTSEDEGTTVFVDFPLRMVWGQANRQQPYA